MRLWPAGLSRHVVADAPHQQLLGISEAPGSGRSAVPSNVNGNGPISMRSPGTKGRALRNRAPLTKVPLAPPKIAQNDSALRDHESSVTA